MKKLLWAGLLSLTVACPHVIAQQNESRLSIGTGGVRYPPGGAMANQSRIARSMRSSTMPQYRSPRWSISAPHRYRAIPVH